MILIVGLGNIGQKYQNTRHNIGFDVLDKFAQTICPEETEWKEDTKLEAYITKIKYQGKSLILAKPTTYMNLSGDCVSKLLSFYKIPINRMIVIYDDVDLLLGKIRFRKEGSAGTHNGMRSIIHSLGQENFMRLRIGIESRGDTSPKQQDLSSFVLTPFNHEEKEIIAKSTSEAIVELEKNINQLDQT